MSKNKEIVESKTLEYFDGDTLATSVFMNKYCLRNAVGDYLEKTPDDMHKRLAKEFFRMESKFKCDRSLTEEQILSYIRDFKYIVPQGSPMYGIGNNHVNVSLSKQVWEIPTTHYT